MPFLLALLLTCPLAAKVLLITHSYNRPDFIELQYATFQRFLKDDYEFVVFNDARSVPIRRQIRATCQRLGLRCIRIHQAVHDKPYLRRRPGEHINGPGVRTANVVQYSLNTLGFTHNDLVAIIDSDMFLIRNFSIRDFMRGHDLFAIPQQREHIHYIWNGLVFLDMPALPHRRTLDFNCGRIGSVRLDTGGYTSKYLRRHPRLRFLRGHATYVPQAQAETLSLPLRHFLQRLSDLQPVPNASELYIDYAFLHYRAGGNWNHMPADFHARKTALLNDFMHELLQ